MWYVIVYKERTLHLYNYTKLIDFKIFYFTWDNINDIIYL